MLTTSIHQFCFLDHHALFMDAYLISSPEEIPSRKQINRIIHKERETLQILLRYVPAVLVQLVSCYWIMIPIPDFYRPRVSPLSYDEGGYREFLFELACWWFESVPINLAQFLHVANVCRWMLQPIFCGQALVYERTFCSFCYWHRHRQDGLGYVNL